jgi:ligand-binding sensor domain-containing protein
MKVLLVILAIFLVLTSCEKKTDPFSIPGTDFNERMLEEYFVTSIDFDQSGNAWIGTFKQGLLKYSPGSTTRFDSTNCLLNGSDVIRDIEVDHSGNVWLACGGLVKYDGSGFSRYTTENSPIPENIVWDIEIDSKNNIWFSSCRFRRGGLVKFDGSNWTVYTPENSLLPSNGIQGLAIDKLDNVWLAVVDYVTETYLVKITAGKWTLVTSDDLGFKPYYFGNIRVNSRNEVCGAIDYSLSSLYRHEGPRAFIYNGKSAEQLSHDSIYSVRSISVDNSDNIWCITYEGYGLFNGTDWYIDHTTFRDHGIFCIEQAPDNKIWIGTGAGIYINN